jgi:integrase/recombinase XerD
MGWLMRLGVTLAAEAPDVRITPERLLAYASFLREGRAEVTVASTLGVFHSALRAMFPDRDWSQLRRLQARLHRRATPSRDKQRRIVPAEQLLQLGLDLMQQAEEPVRQHKPGAPAPRPMLAAARDFRDGLMIALLASRPLRCKNFLQIEIGAHLRQSAAHTSLSFSAAETKDKRAYSTSWPSQLLPALELYLRSARPILIGAKAGKNPAYPDRPAGAFLWLGQGGTPLTAGGLQRILERHTEPRFGHVVTAHLFRDCAATTIAALAPNQVRYAANLLGHHNLRTTERHYIDANSDAALGQHQDAIDELRKFARQRMRKSSEIAR